DELKQNSIDAAANRSFKNENELLNFLAEQVRSHSYTIERELEHCIPKEKGIQDINLHFRAEDFIKESTKNHITSTEVSEKIEQIKHKVITELPLTSNSQRFEGFKNEIERMVTSYINNKIKSNLELCMPFADTRGTIADNKKSSVPNRSSAIKLHINPSENTE